MSVILVLVMFATLLVIQLILEHRHQKRIELGLVARRPAARPSSVATKPVRTSGVTKERYFHPAHTWAKAIGGAFAVGSDEFTVRAIGAPEAIGLPHVGSRVKQGEVLWTIHRRSRTLPQVSPIEGTIVKVNDDLADDPKLLHEAPYTKGWIAIIRPTAIRANLKNMINGSLAESWLEAAKQLVVQRFSPHLGPLYQDGGDLVDGFGTLMKDAEWKIFLREFF